MRTVHPLTSTASCSAWFTLIAADGAEPVALIAVVWRGRPKPFAGCVEGRIDIIEVEPEYRRQGVASTLVGVAADRASERGAYQLRAWRVRRQDGGDPDVAGSWLRPVTGSRTPRGQEVGGYFAASPL